MVSRDIFFLEAAITLTYFSPHLELDILGVGIDCLNRNLEIDELTGLYVVMQFTVFEAKNRRVLSENPY